MAVMTCKLPGRHFPTEAHLARVAEPKPDDHVCPPTEESEPYIGFNVALKPAHEPIVLARRPLSESSIARQVLSTGTGVLNIDASRVGYQGENDKASAIPQGRATSRVKPNTLAGGGQSDPRYEFEKVEQKGRWPSNLLLSHVAPDENGIGGCKRVGEKRVKGINGGDQTKGPYTSETTWNTSNTGPSKRQGYSDPDGTETVPNWECARDEHGEYCCPVALMDEQSGASGGGSFKQTGSRSPRELPVYGGGPPTTTRHSPDNYGDKGGSSRFFKTFSPDTGPGFYYCAKASKRDRSSNGAVENTHSTVKPTALMKYLIKLVTPPGGTVLDCFAGSGSTLVAAQELGISAIGIEQDASYVEICRRRLEATRPQSSRHRESLSLFEGDDSPLV